MTAHLKISLDLRIKMPLKRLMAAMARWAWWLLICMPIGLV